MDRNVHGLEIFLSHNVQIKDYNDEEIPGTFYENKLQETNQEIYRIENVIRKRGNKSLVKWLGYSESFNSWVDNKDLIKL